jgi:hypothetical protein
MSPVASAARAVHRLARSPALHFLALGGLLFAASSAWQTWTESGAASSAAETIVVTAGQVEQLRQDLFARTGGAPSAQQLQAAIEAAVDEEVLYREALASGLDRGNAAIRQRLVQIARFVADDPGQDDEALYQTALQLGLDRSDTVVRRQLAATMRLVIANLGPAEAGPPGDDELEAFLQSHPDRFRESWRIRLSHVYLSDDRRGAAAEADAHRLLGELRAGRLAPDEAPALGDPFLHGHRLSWLTRQGLQLRFGHAFADAAAELEPEVWSDPIRSSYGWHLVFVHAARPPALPALAAVRDEVLRAVLEGRQERRVRETMDALRARYSIQVESLPSAGRASASRYADG